MDTFSLKQVRVIVGNGMENNNSACLQLVKIHIRSI